ncbi:MAG TPA: NAD-dependent epimerase/dehydratase family protein [Candidatus Limnocylindrales bacterium]|nr:NAD-dependent epimerase/dehydratase family protein [Candidatus Limnocylindrales bacterium]
MRVLVTGGAGFVGSNIVDALDARGDLVVALDDLSTGDRGNLAPDLPFRQASVADADGLRKALEGEGFDAIVHCASKTKVVESMEKVDLYRRVIVDGTRNVVALAESLHVQMLVNISTGGAMYGETPVCATEDAPAIPDSNYGRFKLEAEAIVAAASVPNITLRLGNVYGPRQRQDLEGGVVAIFLGRWRRREPITIFGTGTAERDYVYVGDVADAVTSSFAGEWSGVYNIGTGVATSVNTLVERFTEVLGPPPSVERAPARPVETQRSCLDPRKAARDGLWRARTDLVEGLKKTIELA